MDVWLSWKNYDKIIKGTNVCSDYLITFTVLYDQCISYERVMESMNTIR